MTHSKCDIWLTRCSDKCVYSLFVCPWLLLLFSGFLSLWQFITYYEHRRAISYLSVSGYEFAMGESPTQSLNVFKPQAPTKGRERNVYRCCVYGPLRCGKTCFVNSFIGSYQNVIVPDMSLPIDRQSICVSCVPGSSISGTNKVLIT